MQNEKCNVNSHFTALSIAAQNKLELLHESELKGGQQEQFNLA